MRKFHDIYKEKQNRSIELSESKVLNEFKDVYKTLLEKYGISDFYVLNEEEQDTFLTELNSYWTEEDGVTNHGEKFLRTRSDVLCESSTVLQKKNYLKNKASLMISETLRQSELKWNIYDILNEMYNEVRAQEINDVLSADAIVNIIRESLLLSSDKFANEIKHELKESINELNEKADPDAKARNRGDVVFPANSKNVKDNKDHFPLNNIAQARNALARVNQYKSAPSWYKGSLETMVKKVASVVKTKYPSIKVSKAAEKPGKK